MIVALDLHPELMEHVMATLNDRGAGGVRVLAIADRPYDAALALLAACSATELEDLAQRKLRELKQKRAGVWREPTPPKTKDQPDGQ